MYVFPFPFGTAQNDQSKNLTISVWHVLDEIWDELRFFTTNLNLPSDGTNLFHFGPAHRMTKTRS